RVRYSHRRDPSERISGALTPSAGSSRAGTMTEPDLANIVENAVTMMLGVSLGDVIDGDPTSTYSLGASVQFTGEWEGAVVVGCSESFGREAAAALFASTADRVEPDEVADALG